MEFWKVFSLAWPIVLGSAALVAAVIKHRACRAKLARCTLVPGQVESLDYSETDGSEGTYIPWIEVQLPGQDLQRFRAKSGSDPPSYKIGQKVDVYYDPSGDPQFILRGKFEQWGLIGFLYVFGIWGLLTPIVTEWLMPMF